MDTAAHPNTEAEAAPDFPIELWRPVGKDGLLSWITTVDHKRIGLMYGIAAVFFLIVGGFEALLIRTQLAVPNNTLLTAQQYNTLFTMHGTTMIFLAVMPLSSAFFNFIMPLQIGARDVAFPRLNAFSFWAFIAGAIVINLGWFMRDGAPAGGWFGYAPLSSRQYSPGASIDMWVMGLQILGVASVAASLNFIVTIINLRAPGMTMMRLPVFTWMTLITSFLIILAFPAITIALVELMMDRLFGANFFEISKGGMPILWQHLFWVFGHPEVYILILPAMGVVSEVIPTFSRKALFGYPVIVFSGAFIGFIGFGVWSHHMFTTGLGTMATAAFALSTMVISVPTGVKIFNWIGTLWGGELRMRPPMMYALGFIWMFMIGGFSGVMHSAAPADSQQHDSYFVIAHFHYVLIGGSLFALLAAIQYWFPLIFARMMDEFWSKVSFWIIFVGFNVTFFPMHFLGLNGMPRRTFTYDANMGWNGANLMSTIGAFILGLGLVLYLVNVIIALRRGKPAGRDPWDARTLEWSIEVPVPEYNFAVIPRVHALDTWWYEKQHPGEAAAERRSDAAGEAAAGGIHMPHSSVFPFLSCVGLLILGIGVSAMPFGLKLIVFLVGVMVLVSGVVCWAIEGNEGYHLHLKGKDRHP